MHSASKNDNLNLTEEDKDIEKANLLVKKLLKIAEDYEKNISESSAQSSTQVQKTKQTIKDLLELSKQITEPANKVCAEISSKAFSVIGNTVKDQEFYISQLDKRTQEIISLKKEMQDLTHKALYDELTGLGNRHLFKKTFNTFKNDFVEKGQIFSMAMFDLDDFKKINDEYSHDVGDKALSFFAEKIRSFFFEKLGEKGALLRLGGEEFGILSQVPKSVMYILVEAFRKKTSKTYELKHKKPGEPEEKEKIKLTFSGGVVEYRPKLSANGIHKECGEKLKEAKRKGKNIIIN